MLHIIITDHKQVSWGSLHKEWESGEEKARGKILMLYSPDTKLFKELQEALDDHKAKLAATDKQLEEHKKALAAKEKELKEAKDKSHAAEAPQGVTASRAEDGAVKEGSSTTRSDASPGVRHHQQQHSLTSPSGAERPAAAIPMGGDTVSADW